MTISVCMIVKNEEKNLAACLENMDRPDEAAAYRQKAAEILKGIGL